MLFGILGFFSVGVGFVLINIVGRFRDFGFFYG